MWENLKCLNPNFKAAFKVYTRYRRLFFKDESLDYLFSNFKFCRRENKYLQEMKFKRFRRPLKRRFDEMSRSRLEDYHLARIQPPKHQSFPFRAPLMNYLIKRASSRLIQNLYSSCKYFFVKIRMPICHSLYLGNKVESNIFRQFMSVNDPESPSLNNLWIPNSITVDSLNPQFLSSVIPKLGKILLRFLNLRNQNLTVNEYFLLTKFSNLYLVKLYNVSIKDDDGNPITFEDFFSTLSYAAVLV